ncbi:ATP-binding cassette domain-containing protein [Microbacterium sp. TPD7012]|uniref:ABC transporter ATP-binding protein n=1 Tax=unclassified Microbacterium TaxID=2609290 RepID=UPI000D523DA5|nr:ATP-binding cassette domain-containing protein [Microbacterium sp. TPD7012]PVE98263.1 ABC transporter ATP-binding protein [Microbacterium sp. TPD7012]
MTTLHAVNLTKDYHLGRRGSTLRAVDGVSLTVRPGETVALVGESGSGKSTMAKMILRITDPSSGELRLDDEVVPRGQQGVRAYRSRVQMVFQDPFASLNPLRTVRHHLRRPLRVHRIVRGAKEEQTELERLLDSVNLSSEYLDKFPHELSGGQRQRVAIARALAPRPEVLIADEPVSMLDVSIRMEILELLDALKLERNLAVLYITHDLATARHFSGQIVVMRNGRVVERGPSGDVIAAPIHPYTQLLVRAAPDPRSEPFVVDVDRRLRHPEVLVSETDPTVADAADGIHWAREWDDDESVARLLTENRIEGKEGTGVL